MLGLVEKHERRVDVAARRCNFGQTDIGEWQVLALLRVRRRIERGVEMDFRLVQVVSFKGYESENCPGESPLGVKGIALQLQKGQTALLCLDERALQE